VLASCFADPDARRPGDILNAARALGASADALCAQLHAVVMALLRNQVPASLGALLLRMGV
jgi:hypothetical protein